MAPKHSPLLTPYSIHNATGHSMDLYFWNFTMIVTFRGLFIFERIIHKSFVIFPY